MPEGDHYASSARDRRSTAPHRPRGGAGRDGPPRDSPSCSISSTAAAGTRRPAAAARRRSRRAPPAGQRPLEAGRSAPPRRRDERRGGRDGREPRSSVDARRELAGAGRRGRGSELREILLRIPNLPHPEAPDGAGEDDNPVVKGPVAHAGRVGRAPAGPALGDRCGARHPRQRAGREDLRLDVHDAPRRSGRR